MEKFLASTSPRSLAGTGRVRVSASNTRVCETIGPTVVELQKFVRDKEGFMQVEEYETIVETEQELLSFHLFGMTYERLCPELKEWISGRVIASLWNEYAAQGPVGVA